MATVYLTLKVTALFVTVLIPFMGKTRRYHKGTTMELSDWVVNEKGILEDLSMTEPNNHPIKIR
ncbi:MAG TPA: hypothetical protein VHC47_00460 [Mucilaginibacter sp.]|nr:hypothetical protein [Mucilaginibacter sp.]